MCAGPNRAGAGKRRNVHQSASCQAAEEQMQSTIKKVMRDARTWTILLALATTAGAADIFATRAAEQGAGTTTTGTAGVSSTRTAENAKSLLKASSDYMAGQKAFSFDYDTYLQVVTK